MQKKVLGGTNVSVGGGLENFGIIVETQSWWGGGNPLSPHIMTVATGFLRAKI